jgi:hypothetical protein
MRRSELLFGDGILATPRFCDLLDAVGIPGKTLKEIDDNLQARFFQKNPDGSPKERWELNKVDFAAQLGRLERHLALCGFISETKPSHKEYAYAALPGALAARTAIRLQDLIDAWNNGVRWKQTIIFGGKRTLLPDKESFLHCCAALNIREEDGKVMEAASKEWNHRPPKTELEMMVFLFAWAFVFNYGRHEIQDLPNIFVDSPMKPPIKEGGPPVRPNTEDTILEWLKSNPKPGSILLSSGAPYGMAQDEAFWMLTEPHGFTVETFGHAAPDLPIENFMREVAGCVNRIRKARKV